MKPRVYLAGPVQHADDGGHGWRDHVKIEWGDAADWVDPLDKYDVPAGEVEITPSEGLVGAMERKTSTEAISREELVESDKAMVESADAVLARYDDVPSAGTPMEILYAYERDIPVCVWDDSDDKTSPWIIYHADAITGSLPAAVDTVTEQKRHGLIAGSDGDETAEDVAASVPEEAAEVLFDRASHGSAVENHEQIAGLWSELLGHDISAREVALCMICVKMSRSQTGEAIRDHDVDICGYAGIARACEEESE